MAQGRKNGNSREQTAIEFINKANEFLNKNNGSPTIDAVCGYAGINKTTFFAFFKVDNNSISEKVVFELERLRNRIISEKQKIISTANATTVKVMLNAAKDSDKLKAVELAYKIFGTPEQRKRITNVDITTDGESLNEIKDMDFSQVSTETMMKRLKQIEEEHKLK